MVTSVEHIPWNMPATTSIDWQATWPELRCKQIDPIQVVSDFYLTEGLMVHGFVDKFDKPSALIDTSRTEEIYKRLNLAERHAAIRRERIKARLSNDPVQQMALIGEQARIYQVALIENVFPTFWAYTQAACGGELRHHPSIGHQKLSGTRKTAWVQWRQIWETHGEEALILMSKLFHEMSGSLGGPKWAVAAELLISYHRGELGTNEFNNKKVFIDRVLSLQHNGGCFLSKRTWLNARTNRSSEKVRSASGHSYSVSDLNTNHQSMVPILDAHAANPPDAMSLYSAASKTVRCMTHHYFSLAEQNGIQITATWGPVKTPTFTWSPDLSVQVPSVQVPPPPVAPVPPVTVGVGAPFVIDFNKPFKAVFTINKIIGSSAPSAATHLATPIVRSYTFKSKEAFLGKTFYTGHMLKAAHPGCKAQEMSVCLVQGKKQSSSVDYIGWCIASKSGNHIWTTLSKHNNVTEV